MRVCFFIPSFSDGGAQIQCARLINEFRRRNDVEVSLVYLHAGVHDGLLDIPEAARHILPSRSNFDPRISTRLAAVLRENQIDILISWLNASDVHAYFASRMVPSVKWIMTERDSAYPSTFRFWLRRTLGRRAPAIVSNSKAGDTFWRQNRAKGKRFIVTNIVDETTISEMKAPVAGERKIVVSVGRLEEQKNPLITAVAFSTLAMRRPDMEFWIVGEGRERDKIEAVISEAGTSSQVRLLGFRHDVKSILRDASIFASFSHHEGQPNVVLESVTAGTTVVLSAIPEHQDLMGSDYPFYVKNRGDARACADMIERAVDDEASAAHLNFARARLAMMTPDKVADAYLDIFRRMMKA